MVRMGQPPLRIEVLKKISGVEFEYCWRRRVIIEDDNLRIPTISLEDLKRNKRASGRKKGQFVRVQQISKQRIS